MKTFPSFKFNVLLLGLLLLGQGCSEDLSQKGTASEGESYVYGSLIDSLQMLDLEGATVVLARTLWTDSGMQLEAVDTVLTDSTGYFEFILPDSSDYVLRASWQDLLFTARHPIRYSLDSQDLGRLGLYRRLHLQSTLTHVPDSNCQNSLTIALPAQNLVVTADSNGAFTMNDVIPGRHLLTVQCGSEGHQWPIVIPGRCDSLVIDSLDWNLTTGGLGLQAGTGTGTGNSPGLGNSTGLSFGEGAPLSFDASCILNER